MQIDHHRVMIERALQWQTQQDAKFLAECAASTSGEVSQFLTTTAKFLASRDARLWPHETEAFLKHYGETT